MHLLTIVIDYRLGWLLFLHKNDSIMRRGFINREKTSTPYVHIDTNNCTACWKCIEACPNQVISRVNLPWHKHIILAKPKNCIGCYKCIATCQSKTFNKNGYVESTIK